MFIIVSYRSSYEELFTQLREGWSPVIYIRKRGTIGPPRAVSKEALFNIGIDELVDAHWDYVWVGPAPSSASASAVFGALKVVSAEGIEERLRSLHLVLEAD
jgi:hypothetical protein